MAKYDSFIELTPGYESVVDISSDSKSADFWSRYIVNDDMVTAVKLLAKSLRPDDPREDVRHFWIKGSYGTGKTYSAIVIKHLLQDDYATVENFLNRNPLFVDVKDRFLRARQKGVYYVKFRSGECRQLDTSNKFLLQLEQSVREILRENGFAYTGRNSLLDSVIKKVKEFKSTLSDKFQEGEFLQYWGTYDKFEDFYDAVVERDVIACTNAQQILADMNIGLATDLDTFKVWLKDVFDGNPHLAQTGMFVIWDEFTEYIRYNDLDIIQQLSLFSKEVPFFIIYVLHATPGIFSEDVSAGLSKANARFHQIDVSLSEKTTLKLIGESIAVRTGMNDGWADVCNELYSSLGSNIFTFMGDPDSDLSTASLKKIFPIHPMTVNLVSKVAGLAASNRSIFEFLKSNGDDGFRTYIRNNGLYDWKWLTIDYLWDYFFVNNQGGTKDLTKIAEDALKHYNKVQNQINDIRILRVFKAAMLLLATIGSGHNLRKSRLGKGIQATKNTLCDCFTGMMDRSEVLNALQLLSTEPLNALTISSEFIELPYSGTSGELENEIAQIKENNPVSKLFGSDSYFGSVLKKQFVPEEKAVTKRLVVDTCLGTTQQINYKLSELKKKVENNYHQFGMLIVVVNSILDIDKCKKIAGDFLEQDGTKRILVCVLRQPCSLETLQSWYEFGANGSLAQKSGNTVNAKSFQSQQEDLVGEWVGTAIGKEVELLYGNSVSRLYSNKAVLAKYENIVLQVFPAAPEGFIKKITLYKSISLAAAYFGASKVTLSTKNMTDDKQKSFNQQWQDCVDILKNNDENVWDCDSIEQLMAMGETKVGHSMMLLCSTINRELTAGTVLLSDLWEKLQQELGYYNTGICGYLLGFALHFYIGKYTWFDGNNSFKLDKDTIATLIVSMLTGKSVGMKLSSESDVEKRFKDVTRRIFCLTTDEIGDVYDCCKNVKIRITKSGYPLWAAKYLEDDDYCGVKSEILAIIDRYVECIIGSGSQKDIIEDIVERIKFNARVYVPMLNELFNNKAKMLLGMKNFIYQNASETQAVCEKYNFSIDALFTMLSNTLAEEKWQWREQEVENAAIRLAPDLMLVGIVNKALDGQAQSVDKTRENLSRNLNAIQVPGCIYAEMNYDWAPTVATLHKLAINEWVSYNQVKKEQIIKELEMYLPEALDNIRHPKMVLKAYVEKHNLGILSDCEYDEVLRSLPRESFDQSEYSFKTIVSNKIRDLDYSKKEKELLTAWHLKTGRVGVRDWEAENIMPISWVLPNSSSLFATILAIEKKEKLDESRLNRALERVHRDDLEPLTNQAEIDEKFILNVASEKYVSILQSHVKAMKNKIQEKGYRDYSNWDKEIINIRRTVLEFITIDLKTEVSDRAKRKLGEITEMDQLKKRVAKILDNSPEACLLLLDE